MRCDQGERGEREREERERRKERELYAYSELEYVGMLIRWFLAREKEVR